MAAGRSAGNRWFWTEALGRLAALALAALALAALALAALAHPVQAQETRAPIRLQLNWIDQAQFAGFYVADAMGFYEREGIAVTFVPGGPQYPGSPTRDPLLALDQGEADIAVAWMSNAIAARAAGNDAVNVAQIFRHPGMSLICRREAGIRQPEDVKGKRIGLWNIGDQLNLAYWLGLRGLSTQDITTFGQRPEGVDLADRTADCVTAMSYNEYWTLLGSFRAADLFIIRFAEEGAAFLEDGLYAKAEALADPGKRERLVRFLRASAAGWRYAGDNPEVALAATLQRAPETSAAHQRRMLESVLALAEPARDFGLLDLGAFARSIDIVAHGSPPALAQTLRNGWTQEVWREANDAVRWLEVSPAVKHHLARIVDSTWFEVVGLLGVGACMIGGFMWAVRRRYDLWGAAVLTLVAGIGGGTLRDLLIGGARLPPLMFREPIFIAMVVTVVAIGSAIVRRLPEGAVDSRRFNDGVNAFDAIGLAMFTVLGTKVALIAGLPWFWAPFCAALSAAGGGMLRSIVTGREPPTFMGEPYEEIAVAGSLALLAMLMLASRHEHADWLVLAAIVVTLAAVFGLRILVVANGWRSYRLGPRAER